MSIELKQAIPLEDSPHTPLKGNLLSGKKGLIMGVANEKSIAWGIADAAFNQGADLAFTYQGEALYKRLTPLAQKVSSDKIYECDVNNPETIDKVFNELENSWGQLDFVIHSIAFSDKNELKGRYLDTTRDNFLNTMNISCFSLTEVVKRAERLMTNGGSIVTMTYHGAERVMPHYNVMGVAKAALEASVKYLAVDLGSKNIRINAISAGPIRTLAASGIGDFKYILKWNEYNAPLKRNTTIEDVGGAGVYLVSPLSSGTTGEVIYVDSGYHVVGMKAIDAPDISLV
jgi:enoyl-[acyl-carrier protein] reductase I